LTSGTEWIAYCKSGKKPGDIPSDPNGVYADDGWSGMGDWLGTGRVAPGQHRSFAKARAFVRGLKLKSQSEWIDYCKSGKKPGDIPSNPQKTYANDGWAGYGDWLGTGRFSGTYRPFREARAFVRRLGLKSRADWSDYCKSGKKPKDIPTAPQNVYANDGWIGVGDWLGTGFVAWRFRQYLAFPKARAFVRGTGGMSC
jgi:hypothetical protein